MELTKKVKEVAIDITVRISQIVFGALIVSPFLAEKTKPALLAVGITSFLLCLAVSLIIASTIKEES